MHVCFGGMPSTWTQLYVKSWFQHIKEKKKETGEEARSVHTDEDTPKQFVSSMINRCQCSVPSINSGQLKIYNPNFVSSSSKFYLIDHGGM